METSSDFYSKKNMRFLIAISNGKNTMKELKQLLDVDKSNISRRITDCMKKDLIVSQTNPDDRRKKIFTTTKKGDRAADAAQQYIQLIED